MIAFGKVLRVLSIACLGMLAAVATSPVRAEGETAAQKKNAEIVHAVLDNARAGKLDLAEPYFAKDFVLHEAAGLPFGGEYHGWQGYKDCLVNLGKFWKGTTTHMEREFIPVGEDRVFVHFTVDAIIAKNNEHVNMPIVAIWRLENEKIVEIRPFFFDTKRIADLGAK